MNQFLDEQIYTDFRESMSEIHIFIHDEELKEDYNLFSVVIDRLESSVGYLNKNSEQPDTEDEFLIFIMYACIVLDAVKQLFKSLEIESVYSDPENNDSYTFFKDVCLGYPLHLTEEECPTDDKFFEYFRSLSMAHPFETSRPKFFKKGEIQYSPWVINNSRFSKIEDAVGTRIYSNQYDEIRDLKFSFSLLKEYIKSRYLQIHLITEKIDQIIENKREKWKENTIPKGLSSTETLLEIKERLEERYEDTYLIDLTLDCFKSHLTQSKNEEIVSEYLEAIKNKIPDLVDATEELNREKIYNTLDNLLHARPKNMHKGAYYQLEKIFSYLNIGHEGSSNYIWGLEQAQTFVDELGHKGITIDTFEMDAEEIKLLIRIACYFEKRNQMNNN